MDPIIPYLVISEIVFKQLYEKFQSGFRSNHSTETALVHVVNELRLNGESRNCLASLDLSTIDHKTLIHRLEQWVDLSGVEWFKSYLIHRQCLVSLVFVCYLYVNSIHFHSYTDDMQLYILIPSNDQESVDRLTSCVSDVSQWMSQNILQLKQKTRTAWY